MPSDTFPGARMSDKLEDLLRVVIAEAVVEELVPYRSALDALATLFGDAPRTMGTAQGTGRTRNASPASTTRRPLRGSSASRRRA